MKNITIYNLKVVKETTVKYNLKSSISSPKDAYYLFRDALEMDTLVEEYLYMMCLNTKNEVIGVFRVSQGNISSSIVHPREVFKRACIMNSASIIIAHNHPSGNPQPSKEDIDITRRLVECGKILGIDVLDHIIIGEDKYVSLKEKGII